MNRFLSLCGPLALFLVFSAQVQAQAQDEGVESAPPADAVAEDAVTEDAAVEVAPAEEPPAEVVAADEGSEIAAPAVDAEEVPAEAEAVESSTPQATGFWARETAHTHPEGSWSIGVSNPLRYSYSDKLDIETAPLTFLLGSPNAIARYNHYTDDSGLTITGEYGLSIPTGGIVMLQNSPAGPLFVPSMKINGGPLADESTGKVGLWLAPRLGVVASMGKVTEDVITARIDITSGHAPMGTDLPPSLTGWAPFNVMMAPVFRGFRLRVGGGYDKAIGDFMRLRTQAYMYVLGDPPNTGYPKISRFIFEGYAGADIPLFDGDHRITVGAKWYNSDQRRRVVDMDSEGYGTVRYVRSNDFFPTIDYIWGL